MPSYSTDFSQMCSSPGWNDPPSDISNQEIKPRFGNRLSSHKHRRPVHPSIQSSANCKQDSTLSSPNKFSNPTNLLSDQYSQSNPSHSKSISAMSQPSKIYFPEHRPVYDAFSLPDAAKRSNTASIYPSNQDSIIKCDNGMLYKNSHLMCPKYFSSTLPSSKPTSSSSLVEENRNALIYTPPNTIGENKASTTPLNQIFFPVQIKAAGDVSLSGTQLVMFLFKASFKLHPGITRDGIHLRINQLKELVNENRISEGCMKKLNFVVDALDRGLYEDAIEFFEQMQLSYPTEMVSWAQGIRLLINELRKTS